VAEGDAMRVMTKTLVYVRPYCQDEPMTREAMIEVMACEDQRKGFALQIRRLSPQFAEERITVVQCPAGVRVAVEKEDGTLTSVPLVERNDFFGTVMLAPRRRPARLLGQTTDDELLRLAKEYFR
jgi:hypothetical protein